MQYLQEMIGGVAQAKIPVLLVGESGVGKRTFAEAMHARSMKNSLPFLCCTGPEMRRILGEPSRVGTLYVTDFHSIDETTAFWLRDFIAGSGDGGPRLIFGSTHFSEEFVDRSETENRLSYIAGSVVVRIQPLRYRIEDVRQLANYFSELYAKEFGLPKPSLSEAVCLRMEQHSWPENVRELENVVKTLVVVGDERAAVAMLRVGAVELESHRSPSLKDAARNATEVAERSLIIKAMTKNGWNRKLAAQELQISYKALLYKLKKIDSVRGSAERKGTE
jgi:two-component system response regulator AtoC